IVRLADKMGVNPKALVPFGQGVRADFGQTRGAQSGEADRHAVWLAANHLEPKLSPFDPFAVFDEVQRLVPAYNVPRLNLLTGNDEHVKSEFSQIDANVVRRDLVLPANDDLYTSGSLGKYCEKLKETVASGTIVLKPIETGTAAD
ncbi:MAG TPA: NADH-quinone oxidoreductase, partial [Acidobacteriaceae bacterium]|nr:NADH-quinone oxidoreductase [Acidobacteriaceae bacterium]